LTKNIIYGLSKKYGDRNVVLGWARSQRLPPQTAEALAGIPPTQKQVIITLRLMNINKKSQITGTK